MTTETEELVKRARVTGHPTPALQSVVRLNAELADALEAQAARVKKTQRSLDLAMQRSNAWRDRAEKAENRIATLEAQLKAFMEALTKISTRNLGTDGSEVPRSHKPDYLLSCAEQIARDALMLVQQMEAKDGE